MNDPARYAIYFAPETGSALARFGWLWLGREPGSARDLPLPELGLDPEHHAAVIADPRLYGLHATLKPPFRLAEGYDYDDLRTAVSAFAVGYPSATLPPLELAAIDGFLALRPVGICPVLTKLAALCVEQFDRFRAPPTADETAKRKAAGLSPAQLALLERWGYPYVMDQFRFHVSLTGRLPEVEREPLLRRLKTLLWEVEAEPLSLAALCLFEQLGPGERFILRERLPLATGAARKIA